MRIIYTALTVVIFLLLHNPASAQIDSLDVFEVFEEAKAMVPGKTIQLIFDGSMTIPAEVWLVGDVYQLHLNPNQIWDCQTRDELAFVVFHEFAHIKLDHHGSHEPRSVFEHLLGELVADFESLGYMVDLRYNPQGAIDFLKRCDMPADGGYPSSRNRIDNIRQHLKELKMSQ